jgi:hypothetical protein
MSIECNDRRKRNTRRHFSPEDRIRICRAIHRRLEIEATKADAAKRNARLRMLIGLAPFRRRTIDRERCL